MKTTEINLENYLELRSPVGAESLFFQWTCNSVGNNNIPSEFVEIIRSVYEVFPNFKEVIEQNVLTNIENLSYIDLKGLCERYNDLIKEIKNFPVMMDKKPPRWLLKHILKHVYTESIDEPDKLNQYEPFSAEVYGETSHDLVFQIIDQINIKSNDVFLDLGSGVGQVVLQVAAGTDCRLCLGIEKRAIPSDFAKKMDFNFKKWLSWYGKECEEYKIFRGDFLDDEFKGWISMATVLFANNFAFGPSLDHKLKERFADLKDGTRIISSKPFCPLNFRTNRRNLSDIGTIMHVSELEPIKGSVSWTSSPVSYYLHVIDRGKLERYFDRMKNSKVGSFGKSKENGEWGKEGGRDKGIAKSKNGLRKNLKHESLSLLNNQLPQVMEEDRSSLETNSTIMKKMEEVSPSLNNLLDSFKNQFLSAIHSMADGSLTRHLESLISEEKQKNHFLLKRKSQLEGEVRMLETNRVKLYARRANQLTKKLDSSSFDNHGNSR